MTIIRNASGAIIRRSANLRGMMTHARQVQPVGATFEYLPSEAGAPPVSVLRVYFANGDVATSPYASPTIAGRFLNSRRSWGRLKVDGPAAFVEEYASGRRL